jgi:N-acetylmuramoyl-L-alanine amidase
LINPWRGRAFNAAAPASAGFLRIVAAGVSATFAAALLPLPAAASTPTYWFAGTNLVLSKSQARGGQVAVAIDDPAFTRFLIKLNATVAYDPAQRLVIVTSGDRRVITFTLGQAAFDNGKARARAPFAPYAVGGTVFVPFLTLAKALYVVPVVDAEATVLQPQIGGLDVQTRERVTTVTFSSAVPLRFKRISSASSERVSLAFAGVASTLETKRRVGGSAELRGLSIQTSGSARNPTTTVVFDAAPQTVHALENTDTPNVIAIAFAKSGVALGGSPIPDSGRSNAVVSFASPAPSLESNATPTAEYAPVGPEVPAEAAIPPPALATPVVVTSLDLAAADAGLNVRVGLSGPVRYEWHRLGDNRWYVDLKNATLGIPARDEQPPGSAATGLRVKQLAGDPNPTVRIALTLASPRQVNVVASDSGFTISIGAIDDLEGPRVGAGRVAGGALIASVPLASPGDLWSSPAPLHSGVPTNPKLIVIDPGHGGSDTGAAHNGLTEKALNLDISMRLRLILVARGWQVKMTRDTDNDVFGPNDSAHDELQARCDIANNAGARMFVSIHINSYTSSALNGTTTYFYKDADRALADAVHRRLTAIGTADKGVRKEAFYVINHTTMPAALVETAFLSNEGDANLLKSPAFLQRVAVAIADGLGDYAASNPLNATSLESPTGS